MASVINITMDGQDEIIVVEGNVSVNALDKIVRRVLRVFYIENWSTIGVSRDLIEASLIALVDLIEYKLIKDIEKR